MSETNEGHRFDRLPATSATREVTGRATREEVLDHLETRYGIDPRMFGAYTFWEKGAGKVWALRGMVESPIAVEALGIHLLRTRQRHWKLTTDGAQLIGRWATRNVLVVPPEIAARFWAGEKATIDATVNDGYVIVAQELVSGPEPLGVGTYLDGTLQSMVPKGRRRDLPALPSRSG